MSFVKIGPVTVILKGVNVCVCACACCARVYCPYFLTDFGEIRYERSVYSAVESLCGFDTVGLGKAIILLWG